MRNRILKLIFIGLLFSCNSENQKIIDFESTFKTKSESFTINQKNDTVLIGKKGTKIFISDNTFSDPNVKIVLKEFYSTGDFLKAGLTTSSDGKVIESKGMIFLEAFDRDGNNVKNRKQISIQFRGQYDDRYFLFNGNKSSGYINWTKDTLSKNYHIFYNNVFAGAPCINCDYANDTFFIDSVVWEKPFTQYDTIITWSNSKDTIGWNEFWGSNSDQIIKPKEVKRVLNSNKLGWINCDAFLDLKNITNLKIKTDCKGKPYCFAIFKSRNSILEGRLIDGYITFYNVPEGEMVTVAILDKNNNDMFYGELKNIQIGSNEIPKLEVQKQTIENIILKFEKIND